jgi:hypothetical protein
LAGTSERLFGFTRRSGPVQQHAEPDAAEDITPLVSSTESGRSGYLIALESSEHANQSSRLSIPSGILVAQLVNHDGVLREKPVGRRPCLATETSRAPQHEVRLLGLARRGHHHTKPGVVNIRRRAREIRAVLVHSTSVAFA